MLKHKHFFFLKKKKAATFSSNKKKEIYLSLPSLKNILTKNHPKFCFYSSKNKSYFKNFRQSRFGLLKNLNFNKINAFFKKKC